MCCPRTTSVVFGRSVITTAEILSDALVLRNSCLSLYAFRSLAKYHLSVVHQQIQRIVLRIDEDGSSDLLIPGSINIFFMCKPIEPGIERIL